MANALGAIAGNVSAVHTVEIKPNYTVEGLTGYTVFGNDKNSVFNDIDASGYARSLSKVCAIIPD